jgi:hypothetical protein
LPVDPDDITRSEEMPDFDVTRSEPSDESILNSQQADDEQSVPTSSAQPGGMSHSDHSMHGRFVPGTKISGRYRIVALLGRGGMGEVYRADDMKLGQPVALKFLPKHVGQDEKRLELFHNEVRLSRQVAHPNVCRMYDIGEVDGQPFLSMEYIDGEDLKFC